MTFGKKKKSKPNFLKPIGNFKRDKRLSDILMRSETVNMPEIPLNSPDRHRASLQEDLEKQDSITDKLR